ncbi:MAG TPA: hypothetical protein VEF03_03040 [Candidatus Binataceae bacterium]|nr:hypothetical protein [Candidatus Binataceae bacterium]
MKRTRKLDRLGAAIRVAIAQVAAELRRFNSGGITNGALHGMTHAERIAAVKSAMHKRHDGPTRCC